MDRYRQRIRLYKLPDTIRSTEVKERSRRRPDRVDDRYDSSLVGEQVKMQKTAVPVSELLLLWELLERQNTPRQTPTHYKVGREGKPQYTNRMVIS